ncbi:Polysaccharide pyruvyl transferase [Salegentibacter echinorum]|uniref:Polysaccharide pyruvyl transferase n=1 Tax=Salegentibacter echinorum TaxID=1073325 RepID=A0A1M5JUM0_SALEC|nr:polysaccharide pyruvyl transferase family protein [Salegentibacter echinorum]SHG44251.1 Polysaccharide pyruvyl transferase [Salegentibacter echinorum]
MKNHQTIPLFYWSSIKFEGKPKENYGDLLSKYLVEKIRGKPVKWVQPKKQPWYKLNKTNYLAVGSILAHATKDSVVWGSGIIDEKHAVAEADFKAVRGPRTREFLLKSGYECPEVYGDPALLLPLFYNPEVEKKYKIGIVPHYVDYAQVKQWYSSNEEVKVIDLLTDDVEATTREILSCQQIISSSLHGLIVAHAYGIPAVWVKVSDKLFGDGVKYLDYLESVEIKTYTPPALIGTETIEDLQLLLKNHRSLPGENKVRELEKQLMQVCPFR